jgi:thioredoxin 1
MENIMGKPLEITKESFEKDVKQADMPVLLDFWAPWCGPCRTLAPVLDELASEFEGKAVIAKVNVDENPELAQEYRVSGIPSLVFFKGGEAVDQLVGVQQKSALADKLTSLSN